MYLMYSIDCNYDNYVHNDADIEAVYIDAEYVSEMNSDLPKRYLQLKYIFLDMEDEVYTYDRQLELLDKTGEVFNDYLLKNYFNDGGIKIISKC